jgi:hypothetical protein
LLDIVTGIRGAVSFKVQWSTSAQPGFDESRSVRRNLSAGDGGSMQLPIAIQADSELTGLRIVVDDQQSVLPIDAIRLLAVEGGAPTDLKLQNAQADFSQDGYTVRDAIDGNSTQESGNGWAIAPQVGTPHTASFELAAPLEGAQGDLMEILIHHNFVDGQHSLGRFRLSITGAAPPFHFGLPAEIATILAKPADQRNEAERNTLSAHARKDDPEYRGLQGELAAQQQPVPDDPRVKQLEAELAKAREPLPLDSKLQRMSRAVTLSEQQLKDKRLTVAQDIVWALINNPAFLYNH